MEEYDPPETRERIARRLDRDPASIVKLDANENPCGPSPKVQAAIAQARLEEYPDPLQESIREVLSGYVKVPAAHLMLGNGSDELIDMLMRAFLDPGDAILSFPPTFGMYSFNAQQYDATTISVERDDRYEIPLQGALDAITDRTRLIFVTAPNNPTGNQAPEELVRALLDTGCVVVLDEAYAEFAGRTLSSWVPEHSNLVVLRTFSKWAALAGLRAGYAVLPLEIARHLWKLKPPFNLSVAAEAAVRASLEDADWLLSNVADLVQERDRLARGLAEIPFLRPYPSAGNFILCDVVGRSALDVKRVLTEQGILIRSYPGARLKNSPRVSVGRPPDTDALLEALWTLARQ
jgi:histidinol-phosphate aminotransferase